MAVPSLCEGFYLAELLHILWNPSHQLFCSAISLLFPSSPNQHWTISPLDFNLAGGIVSAPPRMGREKQGMFLPRTVLKWVLQLAGFHECGHKTALVLLVDHHFKPSPPQFILLALTSNIPRPSQVALPWWLDRPKIAGGWQGGAGVSPCPLGGVPALQQPPFFRSG